MRERPSGAYRSWLVPCLVLGGLGSIAASVGACTLIAGIDDGVLVNEGPGDGGSGDTGSGDGGKQRTDGGNGHDGGKLDATKGDSGKPDANKGDTAPPPPRPLTCSLIANSLTTADDLSRLDAGTTMFNDGLYVTSNGNENGFGIITGATNGASATFLAYTVQDGVATRTSYPGQLLDVFTTASQSIGVLVTAPSDSGGGGELILFTGPSPGNLVAGPPFAGSGTVTYFEGRGAPLFADAGAGVAYATITQSVGGSPYAFGLGIADEPGGPLDVYEQDSQLDFTGNGGFFASQGALYVLSNQIAADGAQGADAILSAPDNLGHANPQGTLAAPPNMGTLLGARSSAGTPGDVALLGVTLGDAGGVAPCTATVPATMLQDLTLCGEGFKVGGSVSLDSVSNGGAGGMAWNVGTDDWVTAGPDKVTGSLDLLWVGPDARIVATQQSIVPMGTARSTAIQFDSFITESTGSSFDVAWIDRGQADGGTLPDKLVAASVICEQAEE